MSTAEIPLHICGQRRSCEHGAWGCLVSGERWEVFLETPVPGFPGDVRRLPETFIIFLLGSGEARAWLGLRRSKAAPSQPGPGAGKAPLPAEHSPPWPIIYPNAPVRRAPLNRAMCTHYRNPGPLLESTLPLSGFFRKC